MTKAIILDATQDEAALFKQKFEDKSKPKDTSFFSKVFSGALNLISYDSSSLHKYESRDHQKSRSSGFFKVMIWIIALIALGGSVLFYAETKVGTLKRQVLSKKNLDYFELEASGNTMPLNNFMTL